MDKLLFFLGLEIPSSTEFIFKWLGVFRILFLWIDFTIVKSL